MERRSIYVKTFPFGRRGALQMDRMLNYVVVGEDNIRGDRRCLLITGAGLDVATPNATRVYVRAVSRS